MQARIWSAQGKPSGDSRVARSSSLRSSGLRHHWSFGCESEGPVCSVRRCFDERTQCSPGSEGLYQYPNDRAWGRTIDPVLPRIQGKVIAALDRVEGSHLYREIQRRSAIESPGTANLGDRVSLPARIALESSGSSAQVDHHKNVEGADRGSRIRSFGGAGILFPICAISHASVRKFRPGPGGPLCFPVL